MADPTLAGRRSGLPYADLIATIEIDDSFDWLKAGWHDFKAAAPVSILFSIIPVALGFALTVGLVMTGYEFLILPLDAGFLLIGPAMTVGFHAISRELEAGRRPTLMTPLMAWRANPIALFSAGVGLMFVTFIWLRVSVLIIAVNLPYTAMTVPDLTAALFTTDGIGVLIAAVIAGGVIAFIVFATGFISLPMILDRRADLLKGVVISVVALILNFRPLMFWAALIVVFTVAGLLTAYIGLLVTLPLIGHASWHAYRTIVKRPEAGVESGGGI